MFDILIEIVLPFILSALVVVVVTVIAEKYGTKTGGILGTLPTTIIIAFAFIALKQDVDFASNAVAVVPAEMGVNLVFLCVFAILAFRSTILALTGSFIVWIGLTLVLYFWNLQNIYISLIIFTVAMVSTFLILEKKYKIESIGKKAVHYTPSKIILRGVLTGVIISIAVMLSNFGEVLSGIFTVFPAILTSTMLITIHEHGPKFSAGMAKSMILGCWSVMSYAAIIHFSYPAYGILWGSVIAYVAAVIVTIVILKLKNKIS